MGQAQLKSSLVWPHLGLDATGKVPTGCSRILPLWGAAAAGTPLATTNPSVFSQQFWGRGRWRGPESAQTETKMMKSSSRKRLTVAAAAAQTSIRRAASRSPGSRAGTGRRVAIATAPRGTPRLRREKRPARTPPPRRGGGPRLLPAPITHTGKAGTGPSRGEQMGNAWGALPGAGGSEPFVEASARPARRLRLLRRVTRPGARVGRRETLSPVPGSSDTFGPRLGRPQMEDVRGLAGAIFAGPRQI